MAAAEARAAWQRAANRYFVQEDAKRAPKLACCQSSTSSSKVVDAGPANTADAPHRVVGRMPFNSIPSYSNLPPDAKWWLQMQPNNDHQIGPNFQQVDAGIADVESSSPVKMNADLPVREMATMSEESIKDVLYKDLESFMDVKKHPESRLDELNVVDSNKVDQDFLDVKNMTDYYEYLEMEMVGSSVSKQTSEFSSKTDSSWIGGENVPWWRVTDGEDLASFVAQKSFHHVENCDLPPPQKIHQRKEGELYKQAKSIDHDAVFMSSLEWESRSDAISSPSSGGSHRKHWSSVQGLSHTGHAASKPMSGRKNSGMPEEEKITDDDPCKAKLLEALCHSQTRARVAENAAKQAYTEKEHILKLFFRQASQLFAYKQWFKILQLENLLLQTEDGLSPPPAELLPWMAQKPRKKLHKSWQKATKGKRRRRDSQENDIGKYAVAFAVGFTLVGAGLILGWTVGWLLPAF